MGYIDSRWSVAGHVESETPNGVMFHGTLTVHDLPVATYYNDGNGGCCRWRPSETYGHRFAEFEFEARHFRNYREAIGYAVNYEHTDNYLLVLLGERLAGHDFPPILLGETEPEKDSKAA